MLSFMGIQYCLLFVLISVKFLEFVKPFCAVLPEIQKPERKVCRCLSTLCPEKK